MGRRKKENTQVRTFNLSTEAFQKLSDMDYRDCVSRSELLDRIILEHTFINFDVQKEQEEIHRLKEIEKENYERKIRELTEREESLTVIGKEKKKLDKVMSHKKEEYIEKIIQAIKRDSTYEGMEAIAKEGQRVSGVDARQLIAEAVNRRHE